MMGGVDGTLSFHWFGGGCCDTPGCDDSVYFNVARLENGEIGLWARDADGQSMSDDDANA